MEAPQCEICILHSWFFKRTPLLPFPPPPHLSREKYCSFPFQPVLRQVLSFMTSESVPAVVYVEKNRCVFIRKTSEPVSVRSQANFYKPDMKSTSHSSPFLGFLDEKKVVEKKEDGDASLLQSNIWTTLFRGGFANNGKLQRSLSGHHVSPRIIYHGVLLSRQSTPPRSPTS